MLGRSTTQGRTSVSQKLDAWTDLSRSSRLVLLLAFVLVFFEASAYGAVEAWSELTALAISGVIAAVLLLRLAFDPTARGPHTWLWAPLLAFGALGVLQAVELPWSAFEALAPGSAARRTELLGAGPESFGTLSYYPLETWRFLRMLLVGGVLFAVAATIGRQRQGAYWLLCIVFVVGCVEALFALGQVVSQEDWMSTATGRDGLHGVTAGTFLNYSNFCQFINLAIGAGLALLLVRTEHKRRRGRSSASWEDFWKSEGWIVAGLALCTLAVFTSFSRNGVISMLVAGGCFLGFLHRRRAASWQSWSLLVVPVVVFLGLLITGFDLVYDRLATVTESGAMQDRWALTLCVLDAWRDHPWWGIGLGAHEFAFPPYDTTGVTSLAQTADNDYAQLLEETGLVGVACVMAFLIITSINLARLMRRGGSSLSWAAYGVFYALVAIAIHSWTDFGQRLPAVFSLTAILCGLLPALSRSEPRSKTDAPTSSPTRRRIALGATSLLLLGVWLAALGAGYRAYQGEQAWAEAYYLEKSLAAKDWEASDEERGQLLTATEAASLHEPRNVTYAYWLNAYRWQSLLQAVGAEGPAEEQQSEFLGYVSRIANDLADTRRLCVTFGPAYSLEGRLRCFVLGEEEEGEQLIRLGAQLAPHDPEARFVNGLLSAQRGDLPGAKQEFARLLDLSAGYFPQAAEQLAVTLAAPAEAESLCGDDLTRWRALERLYKAHPSLQDRAANAGEQALLLLEQRVADRLATPREIASLAQQMRSAGELPRAIQLYRDALAQDYGNVSWRLSLAQSLGDDQQFDEAQRQVKICLRLSPSNKRATRLQETLYDRAAAQDNTPL